MLRKVICLKTADILQIAPSLPKKLVVGVGQFSGVFFVIHGQILRRFRLGVLKSADESFRQGMKDALEGNTLAVSQILNSRDLPDSKVSSGGMATEPVRFLSFMS